MDLCQLKLMTLTTYLENWGWLAGDELEVSQFET